MTVSARLEKARVDETEGSSSWRLLARGAPAPATVLDEE